MKRFIKSAVTCCTQCMKAFVLSPYDGSPWVSYSTVALIVSLQIRLSVTVVARWLEKPSHNWKGHRFDPYSSLCGLSKRPRWNVIWLSSRFDPSGEVHTCIDIFLITLCVCDMAMESYKYLKCKCHVNDTGGTQRKILGGIREWQQHG